MHPLLAVEADAGVEELKAKSDLLLGMGSLVYLVLLPYCTRLLELKLQHLRACLHVWLRMFVKRYFRCRRPAF